MYLLTNSSSAISIRKVDNFNIERINCRVSSQFSKLAPNVATSHSIFSEIGYIRQLIINIKIKIGHLLSLVSHQILTNMKRHNGAIKCDLMFIREGVTA